MSAGEAMGVAINTSLTPYELSVLLPTTSPFDTRILIWYDTLSKELVQLMNPWPAAPTV